ncbi:TPR-like protein [Rhizopogon vinicolor AM-OR11-026]|uniref:ER membrane protein complex subunit 2 n=1 Tax=Rhizopogon vinicolor AM-OR11-026 TaxID=1314800 RepID=A0A1B7MPG9_9AGAM|nr:TPR-like protein [Rhizopogon vinicolor AM-OR11-026]
MSLQSALEQLAAHRIKNTRASQDVFRNGLLVLQKKGLKKLGDDGWTFLEQLTLASIDVGRLDIADQCLQLIADKFPNSPRVDCLTGIRIEATEPPETALKYYADILEADSANAGIWKRRISVLRRTGKVEKAVNELVQFLDTFYTDVEGWLELADIYATCNQYEHSLQALTHVLLLTPQNPFYMLQAAETAYTAEDFPLAIKMFLTVVDMTDGDDSEQLLQESTPLGITVRAWFGVKLCARRIAQNTNMKSPSNTSLPKKVELLDELATERLRVAYSSSGQKGEIAKGRQEVFAWVAAPLA